MGKLTLVTVTIIAGAVVMSPAVTVSAERLGQKKTVELGEADYVGVPQTLQDMVDRASLVVRVRITTATERAYQIQGARSHAVRTDVSADVREVFKADGHTSERGQTIHVLHPA